MVEIAYLSGSGEVKIPLRLRTRLGLQPGEKFEVRISDGSLVFTRRALPSHDQVARFIEWSRKNASRKGPRTIVIGGRTKPRRRVAAAKSSRARTPKKAVARGRRQKS